MSTSPPPNCNIVSPLLLNFVDSSSVFQPSSTKLRYRPDWGPKPPKLLPLQIDVQDQKWLKLHLVFWCLRDHSMPGIFKHMDTLTCSKCDARWWMHQSCHIESDLVTVRCIKWSTGSKQKLLILHLVHWLPVTFFFGGRTTCVVYMVSSYCWNRDCFVLMSEWVFVGFGTYRWAIVLKPSWKCYKKDWHQELFCVTCNWVAT